MHTEADRLNDIKQLREAANALAAGAGMDRDRGFVIVIMTNRDPAFYPTLGPFLARRSIANELGGPLWDEDGKTWCVALDGDERVAGFASLQRKPRYMWLDDAWVTEAWRGRGVFRALTDRRLELCPPDVAVRRLAMPDSVEKYVRRGFRVLSHRGRYTTMELPAQTTATDAKTTNEAKTAHE